MLSVFPLMYLSLLAHAILRAIVGVTLIYFCGDHLRGVKTPGAPWKSLVLISIVELVLGIMFIVGAFTQIAALGAIAYAALMLALRRK